MASEDAGGGPERYTERVRDHLEGAGWSLDRTHVSGDVYLLGGTNRPQERTGVVIVAAGEGATLERDHLRNAKKAKQRYDADAAMAHARGTVPEDTASLAAEHDIEILPTAAVGDGPEGVGGEGPATNAGDDGSESAVAGANDDGGDSDEGSHRTRRAVLAVGLLGGLGTGGWYLREQLASDDGFEPPDHSVNDISDSSGSETGTDGPTASTPDDGGGSGDPDDGSAGGADVGGAPMFQYDLANTGHAPGEDPLRGTDDPHPESGVTVEMSRPLGEELPAGPAVVDGTVYVGGGRLRAIDIATASSDWGFDTVGRVDTTPTVVDGTVYASSQGGRVYAVDAESGTERWQYEVDTYPDLRCPPVVADGVAYVGTPDNKLLALNADSGERLWQAPVDGEQHENGVPAAPALVDGTLYVPTKVGTLHALSTDGGTEQWTFDTGDDWVAAPSVLNGTVYVATSGNQVYAVDAASGEQIWTYSTGEDPFISEGVSDDVYSSTAVANGTVYVGSYNNGLHAISAADGTREWREHLNEDGFENDVTGSPTVAGGTVYVGSYDNNIYALDAADGTEYFRLGSEFGEDVAASPVAVDGYVFYGFMDGRFRALTGG
jgi:outer membrane protein assembly factor BamB